MSKPFPTEECDHPDYVVEEDECGYYEIYCTVCGALLEEGKVDE